MIVNQLRKLKRLVILWGKADLDCLLHAPMDLEFSLQTSYTQLTKLKVSEFKTAFPIKTFGATWCNQDRNCRLFGLYTYSFPSLDALTHLGHYIQGWP